MIVGVLPISVEEVARISTETFIAAMSMGLHPVVFPIVISVIFLRHADQCDESAQAAEANMFGISFIGENGFCPAWVKGAGQWVFQRTLVIIGGMEFAAFAAAERVGPSREVIVWVPRRRGIISGLFPCKMHKERKQALDQLSFLQLVCFQCSGAVGSPSAVRSCIQEAWLKPENWRLRCPSCEGIVGPDLASVNPDSIIKSWLSVGRPPLENPAASASLQSAAAITDLPKWISETDPSHLELAYVAQQMWPDIKSMLDAFGPAA